MQARCARAALFVAVAVLGTVAIACKKRTAPAPAVLPARAHVTLDASGVSVDGERVVPRADVPTSANAIIVTLRTHLKNRREDWKHANPGKDFPGFADATIPAAVSCVEGMSVIATMAAAGYHDQSISIGAEPENAPMWLPRLVEEAEGAHATNDTFATVKVGGTVEVRGNPCMALYDTVKIADIGAVLRERCGGEGCVGAIFVGCEAGVTFGEAFTTFVMARRAHPNLSLGSGSGCDDALGLMIPPDSGLWPGYGSAWDFDPSTQPSRGGAPLRDAGLAKSAQPRTTIRSEPAHVEGPLDVAAFERAAMEKWKGVRACYEGALRRDPTLAGRVSVALTIGTKGGVASVKYGGGDITEWDVTWCIHRAMSDIVVVPAPAAISKVVYTLVLSQGT